MHTIGELIRIMKPGFSVCADDANATDAVLYEDQGSIMCTANGAITELFSKEFLESNTSDQVFNLTPLRIKSALKQGVSHERSQ